VWFESLGWIKASVCAWDGKVYSFTLNTTGMVVENLSLIYAPGVSPYSVPDYWRSKIRVLESETGFTELPVEA